MKSNGLGFWAIFGLFMSALGIVVPIVWDQYTTRTALEITQLSNSVIVKKSQAIDGLQFVYVGREVPSLSRVVLRLTNSGRTPIRQEDVVRPVSIKLSGAKALDVNVSKVEPDDLEVEHSVSDEKDRVEILFPLLNPGDSAYLTLLVDSEHVDLSGSARIAGLDGLTYTVIPDVVLDHKDKSWAFYIVAVMTALAACMFCVGLYMAGVEVAIARAVKRSAIEVPVCKSIAEYKNWVKEKFSADGSPEVRHLEGKLRELMRDERLTEEQLDGLSQKIRSVLTDDSGSRSVLVFFGVLALIGNVYIYARLW